MTIRVPALCVVLAVVVSCGSAGGADPPPRPDPPKNPVNLCEALGAGSLDRLVPGGEPRADGEDFGGFSESTCSVSSPTGGSGASRRLWLELNRYGPEPGGGRSGDEICREAMRSSKLQDAEEWQHASAEELPLRIGDVAEAQVRSVRYDAEAEILSCRSGDYVRVLYEADEIAQDGAASAAEDLARQILDAVAR